MREGEMKVFHHLGREIWQGEVKRIVTLYAQ